MERFPERDPQAQVHTNFVWQDRTYVFCVMEAEPKMFWIYLKQMQNEKVRMMTHTYKMVTSDQIAAAPGMAVEEVEALLRRVPDLEMAERFSEVAMITREGFKDV
jgi:hypothetical protein